MKKILLTLDYELYGNGTGNIYTHIIKPTNSILAIANKYNAKLTIFVEIVELWRIEEEWLSGHRMGYDTNPIHDIIMQLQDARRQGHDIQLHIHPQWVDAKYINGKWIVNLDNWRLGGYSRVGKYSLQNLLNKGKATLEEWIRPVDPTYTCIAIRAGGYNIQPSSKIVKAMQVAGLKIDSSIFPGGKEIGTLSNFDYSSIDKGISYWHVGNILEEQGNSEIIELPIVAFPIRRWEKYASFDRIKSLLRNRKSATDSFIAKTNHSKSSRWDKVKYFFQIEWQTWDYCLFSPFLHKKFLKQINCQQSRDYFTLVGHPKGFTGRRGFEYLLSITQDDYNFITIREFYDTK